MSHYSLLVILDGKTRGSSLAVDEALAPYQENDGETCPQEYLKFELETPAAEVESHVTKILAENQDFAEEVKDLVKEKNYQEILRKYDGTEPDEDGNFGYWENPYSKWDWYVIGGRWSGLLARLRFDASKWPEYWKQFEERELGYVGEDKPEKEQRQKAFDLFREIFNFSEHELPNERIPILRDRYDGDQSDDCSQVKDFSEEQLKALKTFAVLTQDGEWHENGKMGWWGVVRDEKESPDDWDSKYYDRFIKNLSPNTYLVVVDCHV